MTAPLEGALVRLRAPEPEDRDTIHPWLLDGRVMRYNEVRYPVSLAGLRERPLDPPSYDLAHFAVVARDSGQRVGEVSVRTAAPENRCGSLAMLMGPPWQGRGYGTEALWLASRFGFEAMNLHRLELYVVASNERARRVYERIGFRAEGRLREAYYFGGCWEDWLLMSMLCGEFPAACPTVERQPAP